MIIEDNSASGDRRVARHMSKRGYVHFRRTGVNEWYAHESDTGLLQPDAVRSFERTRRRERRVRLRKHVINRIATRAGRYFPNPAKRRLRALYEAVLRR